jgi:putative N6-adenine-specific DNA methylase
VESPRFAVALCAIGLERVCQAEIERIGLPVEGREPGRVRFGLAAAGGAAASLMRADLCLRTAERVLIEAGRFQAPGFDELFESVRALPWELYFRREDRLVVERVRTRNSRLSAQTSIQSVVHKAVYERLGAAYGLSRLPETGRARGLRAYLDSDACVLGLDASGEALHKRGYRLAGGVAPLKETVAAGVLFLSGWNRRLPLLDPFCGSGTIAIEAAFLAMDRAPGLGRSFGFEDMPFALGAAEARAVSDEAAAAEARIRRDAEFRISASDADPAALEAARANAARAGVAPLIAFSEAAAEEARPAYDKGSLICNPPYGERLGTVQEARALYRRMGEAAEGFKGWGLGFVTNAPDFGDYFGRAASRPRKIINGAEEQWFHWYPPSGRQGDA